MPHSGTLVAVAVSTTTRLFGQLSRLKAPTGFQTELSPLQAQRRRGMLMALTLPLLQTTPCCPLHVRAGVAGPSFWTLLWSVTLS